MSTTVSSSAFRVSQTCPGTNRRTRKLIQDRKSTRLNSSHGYMSYAVFCLKKKQRPDALVAHQPARLHDGLARLRRSFSQRLADDLKGSRLADVEDRAVSFALYSQFSLLEP